MSAGVYEIVNLIDGKRYVGSAIKLKKRLKDHRLDLEKQRHHSRFLQRSWNKYGPIAFEFHPLLFCDRHNLIFYEQRAIDALKPEFNTAPIAGSQLGYRHTDETRAKLRAARARNPVGPNKGRKFSAETCQRISIGRRGKGCIPCSPEKAKKIGDAQRGKIIPAETRAQIARTLTGRKQSAETIAKRAAKLSGRKMPPGFAEATSQRMLGSKCSEKHCENIGRSKAKLSDEQVREIRLAIEAGETQRLIAARYGVDPSVISTIKARRTYAWVN